MLPICYNKRINDWREELYTFQQDGSVGLRASTDIAWTDHISVGKWQWIHYTSQIHVEWITTNPPKTFLTHEELDKVNHFYIAALAKMIVE